MTEAASAKRPVPEPLYKRDLHAWSLEQARLLRAGKLDQIDAENIAEEILDVGSNEFDKLESALRVLLMHMLKWDHQPERRSRSWANSIAEGRYRAQRQLRKNPSLKSHLDEALSEAFWSARLGASGEADLDLTVLPETCPYDWDTMLNRPFEHQT